MSAILQDTFIEDSTVTVLKIREIVDMVLGHNSSTQAHPSNLSLRTPARTEILVHAMPVFVIKGVEKTTVQDLLDAASISRRTFYKYFKNKYDVLESVYCLSMEILMLRIQEKQYSADKFEDMIDSSVDAYFDYHTSLGPIISMMHEEALRVNSPLAKHRLVGHKFLVGLMSEQVERFLNKRYDSIVFYSLVWMIEAASQQLLNDTNCSGSDIIRRKSVMSGMMKSVLINGSAAEDFSVRV